MQSEEKSKQELLKELLELQQKYNYLKELYESNISERKLAEEELNENKEKYRGLSEAAFESIFISEKGLCIEQNQTAEKVFGYTYEEATQTGKYGTEWIAEKDRDMVMKNMLAGYEEPYEVTAKRKDGTTFPCMLRGKMMHYKGRIVRVTSLSDITERKRVEEELIIAKEHAEESERLKSSFLANMSHEIRTPMNGILGFAGLLKDSKLTGEEQQQYISIIEKSGARMLNVINDIVDISKIESGLMEVDVKESSINDQLEFIYNFFKPEVDNKGIKLSYFNSLIKQEAIILTDHEKLYAILINLVKNAIKYSDKGSIEFGYNLKQINTETELSEQQILEFYVKDTGIGIPKDRQEAVFMRFIQADNSDSRAYQGAGLGLSIAKAYVKMLGGSIWVESEVDKGSTFYFTIPYNMGLEENIISDNYSDVDEANIKNNLKILIVEDDIISEKFLATVVKKYCKEMLIAKNGLKAVEICRQNSDIDLILMDINMAEMNGYESTKFIRKFNNNVIIIAQTAHGLVNDKKNALDSGCNEYISKPINLNLLKGLIGKYFSKSLKN